MVKVSLEEKVKIFQRFAETKEELKGSTIFEGYPIGQWAIQIRSALNNQKNGKTEKVTVNPTEEQLGILEDLGILERQIDSTIDEKINALIEWRKKYPSCTISPKVTSEKLREVSKSRKEYKQIIEEYDKIQSYYDYVRVRKSQGKLTEEQIETCKEGNIGGVLEYSTKVEELSKKYNIPEKATDHILGKYSSIEQFYEQYKNGTIKDFDDIDLANSIFKRVIDIDGKNNPYLEKKFAELFDATSNSKEMQIIFYSSEGLKKAITTLTPREQRIIERRFDLKEEGLPRDLESIGKEFPETSERIREILAHAVRKLRRPSRTKSFIFDINELEESGFLMDEEKKQLLKKAITTLTPMEQRIIERRFDLNEEGLPTDFESIGKEFPATRERIRKIEAHAIRKLIHPSRTKSFIVDINDLKNSEFLTDEEKKQLAEIEDDIIIDSNTDSGSKYIETLQSIYQAFQDRKTLNEETIEQMDFSVRTQECLKKVGVKTINDLTNMTEEELRSVRNIGSGVDEVLAKIAEYNLSLATEQDNRKPKDASAITIEEMNLSVRAFNSLARAGIKTLDDLIKLSEEDLRKIKNLGSRGAEEVLRKIKEYEIENSPDEVQKQTDEDIMQGQTKTQTENQTELENEAEHIESIIQDSNEQESDGQESNEQMASNQESSEQYHNMTTEQLQELIARNTKKIAENEETIKSRLIARLLEQQKIISGQEKVINALEEERAQKKEI